jgi:soluble lytic murein transglycosylase-like protein
VPRESPLDSWAKRQELAKKQMQNQSQSSQIILAQAIASPETVVTPKEVIVAKEQMQTQELKQSEVKVKNVVREVKIEPKINGNCYDYVGKYATKYNVDGNLMRRIIKAESGGNANAKNKTSTASGCAQFIKATWAGTLKQMQREWVSPFDAETNVEALAWKISQGGLRAWDASKSKWSK